eukprot:COSAG02_NODE_3649_length_6431_cov_488.315781_6_plen_26_part_01
MYGATRVGGDGRTGIRHGGGDVHVQL